MDRLQMRSAETFCFVLIGYDLTAKSKKFSHVGTEPAHPGCLPVMWGA